MKINEVIIQNKYTKPEPAGYTSINDNIDYEGFRVLMKPSVFLELATYLPKGQSDIRTLSLLDHMKKGGAIASPFLLIEIPDEWKQGIYTKPAAVCGHEGRHRCHAILSHEDDTPIEVHLCPRYGLKARDVRPAWITAMNKWLIPEWTMTPIGGPFFTLIK